MPPRIAIATMLALLTGFVFGQILALTPDFEPGVAARDRSTKAAAGAFYTAVNRYLELGEDVPLIETLDAGFVDHSPLGTEPTTAGFVRYLASLRAAYPDLRLEPESLAPQGNIVTVMLATGRGTSAMPGELVLDRPPSPAGYEQLRIEHGKVAERWASQSLPPQAELIASLDVPQMAGWSVECAMEWLTFEPGSSRTDRGLSDSLLIVTSGTLELAMERGGDSEPRLLVATGTIGERPLQRGVSTEMMSESVVRIPGQVTYRLHNLLEQPATAILVEIRYLSPATLFTNAGGNRIDFTVEEETVEQVGYLPPNYAENQTFVLSLIRLTAAPNQTFPMHTVSGLEQVLVDDSTLDVTVHLGTASVIGRDDAGMVMTGDHRELRPGEGITADPKTLLSYRISGEDPATLWGVVLLPSQTPLD